MTDNTATTSDTKTLAQLIEFARESGRHVRAQAARTGYASIVEMEQREEDAGMCAIRAQATIAQVPLLVARAIACSWDQQIEVPVMVLNQADFPGPSCRSPHNMPPSMLTPSQLGSAGKVVFDYLAAEGMNPLIKYVYDGMTRTFTLQIAIPISF